MNSFFPQDAEQASDYADLFESEAAEPTMNEMDVLRAELADVKARLASKDAEHEAEVKEAIAAIQEITKAALSAVNRTETEAKKVHRQNVGASFVSGFLNGAFGMLGAGAGFGARRAAYRR